MKQSLLGWSAALVLVAAVPVMAHHSPAAFEPQKTVTLTGVVKEFR